MKAMEHQWYDLKSWGGSAISIILAYLGFITVNELAVICAIGVSVTTIVYTVIKIWKELKRK